MERLGSYILSVTTASILLSILQSLLKKQSSSAILLKLVGGLYLAFTVISPIADIRLDGMFDVPLSFYTQGNTVAGYGHQTAQSHLESIIKDQCETYILDKALSYQAELDVEVTLSDDEIPVPCSVQLRGPVSPYARAEVEQWLIHEMGISKENQQWIG